LQGQGAPDQFIFLVRRVTPPRHDRDSDRCSAIVGETEMGRGLIITNIETTSLDPTDRAILRELCSS
jgi:hypothetical protein